MNVSLREIKKARSKIALYEASLELMGSNLFHTVKVEDICAKAEVSKVTFFKFFAKKEDVLVYFMNIWLLERVLELEDQRLRGAVAIRRILDAVVVGADRHPGLMLSLIGFLAETKMHPCMPVLSDAEFHLLFPGREERAKGTAVNLFELFTRLMEEAKEDGECARPETAAELSQWLITVFYGAYLTAHMCAQDVHATYEAHLKLILTNQE